MAENVRMYVGVLMMVVAHPELFLTTSMHLQLCTMKGNENS